MLIVLLATALANQTSSTKPHKFEALTPAQVFEISEQSEEFCRADREGRTKIPAGSRTKCELDQPFLIQQIDSSIATVNSFRSPHYAKTMVERCFEFYNIGHKGNLERLAECLEQAAMLAEQESHDAEVAVAPSLPDSRGSAPFDTTAFCRRVAESVGGSYVLLEQCLKDEAAARKRVR